MKYLHLVQGSPWNSRLPAAVETCEGRGPHDIPNDGDQPEDGHCEPDIALWPEDKLGAT